VPITSLSFLSTRDISNEESEFFVIEGNVILEFSISQETNQSALKSLVSLKSEVKSFLYLALNEIFNILGFV
jgi:hypothetical protein